MCTHTCHQGTQSFTHFSPAWLPYCPHVCGMECVHGCYGFVAFLKINLFVWEHIHATVHKQRTTILPASAPLPRIKSARLALAEPSLQPHTFLHPFFSLLFFNPSHPSPPLLLSGWRPHGYLSPHPGTSSLYGAFFFFHHFRTTICSSHMVTRC